MLWIFLLNYSNYYLLIYSNIMESLCSNYFSLCCRLLLTLRLLISVIYGAPSKARNANVVYIWTYVWQRWNSLFLFAAQCFNTESMQRGLPASWQIVYTQMWHRKPLCIDSVLKHCAANRKRLFQRCQTEVHIYKTLAFLALLGAPYIYDISSLRVNNNDLESMWC